MSFQFFEFSIALLYMSMICVQGQINQSPCENIFQYYNDGYGTRGIVTLLNNDAYNELLLEAEFTLPPGLPRDYNNGKISLTNQLSTVFSDIAKNLPLVFNIEFGSQNPVPKLVSIKKNNEEICRGPIESSSLTRIKLNYKLKPAPTLNRFDGNNVKVYQQSLQPLPQPQTSNQYQQPFQPIPQPQPSNQYQQPSQPIPQPQPSNPYQQPSQPIPQPQPSNPYQQPSQPIPQPQSSNQYQQPPPQTSRGYNPSDDSVCGIPVAGVTQSLIIGGEASSRGEWPWLVAMYRSGAGELKFICGGSLVSSIYTITAAHCIQDKRQASQLPTQSVVLFIGKHNLFQYNEVGFEQKGASLIKIHQDWRYDEQRYDADIALIKMDSSVTYSKFIRPICLWSFQENVIGAVGVVAGWGTNDYGVLNLDYPKKVNMPIITDGQCLRSNEAFVHITSDRTFCAGGARREGPCKGDSGGGLVLKSGRKWYIRGIVSASLKDGDGCDVSNYAIFTDVAKYISWIKYELSQ